MRNTKPKTLPAMYPSLLGTWPPTHLLLQFQIDSDSWKVMKSLVGSDHLGVCVCYSSADLILAKHEEKLASMMKPWNNPTNATVEEFVSISFSTNTVAQLGCRMGDTIFKHKSDLCWIEGVTSYLWCLCIPKIVSPCRDQNTAGIYNLWSVTIPGFFYWKVLHSPF